MIKFSSTIRTNYEFKQISEFYQKKPLARLVIEYNDKNIYFDTDALYPKILNRMTSNRRDGKTFTEYHHSFLNWLYMFEDNWVFYDIGGNIGLYSFIASQFNKINSYIFEPEINNAAHINNTIYRNNLTEKCFCLPIALGSDDRWLKVRSTKTEPGYSGASIIDVNEADSVGHPQIVFQTSIDSLLQSKVIEQPNAIKIDVDGPELSVLKGAQSALKNQSLKTVCFEQSLESEEHQEAYKLLESFGFIENSNLTETLNSQFRNVFMFRDS